MTVVCLDLDRTIIYSAAALDLRDARRPRRPGCSASRCTAGAPLSFLTEAAADALRALQDVATVVPTTTRTPEQLARVRLPGPPARYAIAANGGAPARRRRRRTPTGRRAVRERLAGCAPLAEVRGPPAGARAARSC